MKVIPISEYWNQILSSKDEAYLGLIYRVPPRLWRDLRQVQELLRAADPNQLYAHPSSFHITLKGLGYLERTMDNLRYEKAMKKIAEIISDFKPFQLSIRGLGYFPTCVYAKVEDPTNQLLIMNSRIVEELGGEVEKSEYDGAGYVPHITLATFNSENVQALLRRMEAPDIKDYNFGECAVFEIEAVQVNLLLALGPEETQDAAFSYVRSFHLLGK